MGAVIDIELGPPPDDAMFANEQKQAVADLLRHNVFTLKDKPVPGYRVRLAQISGVLVMTLSDSSDITLKDVPLRATSLMRLIRQYRKACEGYYTAVQGGDVTQIEAQDAERRRLHDVGAQAFQRQLDNLIDMDLETARRFFTLLASLYAGKMTRTR